MLDLHIVVLASTVDSGYSHIKYFQEKCDCKRSVTLSGVAQNSELDYRKCMTVALHRGYLQVFFPSEMSLEAHTYIATYKYFCVRLDGTKE